jgi:hypothetical protein
MRESHRRPPANPANPTKSHSNTQSRSFDVISGEIGSAKAIASKGPYRLVIVTGHSASAGFFRVTGARFDRAAKKFGLHRPTSIGCAGFDEKEDQ